MQLAQYHLIGPMGLFLGAGVPTAPSLARVCAHTPISDEANRNVTYGTAPPRCSRACAWACTRRGLELSYLIAREVLALLKYAIAGFI